MAVYVNEDGTISNATDYVPNGESSGISEVLCKSQMVGTSRGQNVTVSFSKVCKYIILILFGTSYDRTYYQFSRVSTAMTQNSSSHSIQVGGSTTQSLQNECILAFGFV